jgi:transcriptional regulator with XRE-family HTH domain
LQPWSRGREVMQMVAGFGARLRAQREEKKVSLRAIAEETKIKASLLEGLEEDDLAFWPQGLFRRAYVRAYARAIGLEPERVLREFLEKYPEPVEVEPGDEVTSARSLLSSPIATVSSLLRRSPRNAAPLPAASPIEGDAVGIVEEVSPSPEPSFLAMSDLCTRIARLPDRRGLPPLLDEATGLLHAIGLVVWSWDARAAALRAELANGYSEDAIAEFPAVPVDAPNAVAAAFRSRQACVVPSGAGQTGAVAVPLMAPAGCIGVLAIEVQSGCEHLESVRAFLAILAAQLVGLIAPVALAEAVA